MSDTDRPWGLDTLAIREGIARTQYNEHNEPLFLSSSFVFDNAAQAAARFAGDEDGFIYSRAGNPTVAAFQNRLAALEGGEACVATASGMSAIMATVMSLTRAGDHVVAAFELFGATLQLFGILQRFGIEVTFVRQDDIDAWRAAIRPNTKLLYLETPSNPLTTLTDVRALAAVARERGVMLAVDNCFCSPALQTPLAMGADIVVHSATKYIDGQGRVLGGAVVGGRKYIEETLAPFVRTTGPTLSAFNAWVLQKGLETLGMRMQRQSANALALATWLQAQPGVSRVHYPGLPSHPQHALALAQQKTGGAIVSFELGRDGEDLYGEALRRRAWAVVDTCRLMSITANLGDVKTTITHPASTTHGRAGAEARRAAGVNEGLIRIAVGAEDPADLIDDLGRALASAR
ncbi:MAG: O-succinylhomoserine sulfhydrylase [Burkholderiaceae bacterium]|jgi:O-succinylhomoserine sulfhydrylase|nr:O-succinylhomoserine sulfhydrylase [Burkholderiales bacterium]MCZ8337128.1 O-succinylhomoserine sulfhydrylase [Burkholderiaceae bacterium]